MARIAVGGFHHETNCFVKPDTDYAYFASHRDRPPLVRGEAVFEWLGGSSFALAGFMQEMQPGHELVPLLWTSGGAGGLVTADAFERITGELIGRLSEAMPVDAVYLDLHGAMVSAPFEDGEGELLRRVRAVVGEAVPVVSAWTTIPMSRPGWWRIPMGWWPTSPTRMWTGPRPASAPRRRCSLFCSAAGPRAGRCGRRPS